jgi:hypothetical protein
MNSEKLLKLNKPWIGLLVGLIIPLISFYVYFLLKSGNMNLSEFVSNLKFGGAFVPIFSLCVLPNLFFFFLCKQFNLWYTIKGIVFSVFIYTLVVVVLKFM